MTYETFEPHPDLASIVKFYWTLEVPFDPANHKQKIIPDGCIEMTFNFKDGIKKYVSEDEYIVHPSAMIMGQRTKPYYIEPVGEVQSFAVCFYPYGFANFINKPLKSLADLEAPIETFFGETDGKQLSNQIIQAQSTSERINFIESFLLQRLREQGTIENIVKSTVDSLLSTNGNTTIGTLLNNDLAKRRKLERDFQKQIGISPKQLSKIIRLQTALNLLLNSEENLTSIAYESDYFDQAHFIRDFKSFTGITPKEFLGDKSMELATLFYK